MKQKDSRWKVVKKTHTIVTLNSIIDFWVPVSLVIISSNKLLDGCLYSICMAYVQRNRLLATARFATGDVFGIGKILGNMAHVSNMFSHRIATKGWSIWYIK